jgi:hypothetical protein
MHETNGICSAGLWEEKSGDQELIRQLHRRNFLGRCHPSAQVLFDPHTRAENEKIQIAKSEFLSSVSVLDPQPRASAASAPAA